MGRTGWLALALAVAATPAPAGGYHGPHNARGAPDLSGLWSNSSLTGLERPDELKTLVVPEAAAKVYETGHRAKPQKIPDDTVGAAESEFWETDVGLARIRGQARSSWIVSPSDGKLPYTAAAKAANKARRERRNTAFDGPEVRPLGERCLGSDSAGPPLSNTGFDDNFKLVQTGDRLAILAEYMGPLRIVRIGDTRHPPPAVRSWMGDSIGRWEGDTLVVETTNFRPEQVLAPDGDPGADMKVVERFTRTSPTELYYEFSVTNPARYTQTWRGEMIFHPAKGRLFEFACHEGNYAIEDILRGARHAEAQAKGAAPAR